MNSRWFEHTFCHAFPLAHFMREAFPETWLRIHSLPASRRYPSSDAEQEVVFERYSRFSTALLGERAPCVVIQSCIAGSSRNPELLPELDWTPIHRVAVGDDDSRDSWMAKTTCEAAAFRGLLLAIADDQEDHIAFLSELTDNVFIPYDGGADGFSLNADFVRRLSTEFGAWRSVLPSGL